MNPNPALAPAASPRRMAAARRRGVLAEHRWRKRPDVAGLAAVLASFSADPPPDCDGLRDRLTPWLTNDAWIDAFIGESCAAMRDDPFAAFPFLPVQGRTVQGLALLQTNCADAALCWIDALTLPQAQNPAVVFSSALSVVKVVRAGGLIVQAYRLDGQDRDAPNLCSSAERCVKDGEVLLLDNRYQSLSMLRADTDAIMLRISVQLPKVAPQRSFDISSGRLIGTAMADDHVSRMLPLLSVARLAGQARTAAPVLAVMARHPDPVLRWAAMREWLVADTRAAFAQLPAMAIDDPDPQVRGAAAATFAALAAPEPDLCPA